MNIFKRNIAENRATHRADGIRNRLIDTIAHSRPLGIIQIEVYKDGRHAEERIDRRNVKDAGLDVETFFDYVLLDLVSLVDERTIAEGKEEITFYADGLASTETVAIRVKERGEDREGSSNQ